MSLPLYDNGFWPALVLGLLFGLALEGAGFGSPRKLVAQFTLRDFTVFKVMFTAVVVAAVGLWLAEAAGVIAARSVYIPTLYFWAIALGGVLMGAGFAVGGYCPGTSTVGLASGRLDAAGLFEPLEALYLAAPGPKGQTLDQLFDVPTPVVLAVLIAVAALGWWLGSKLEARFGGPVSAAEVAGKPKLSDQGAAPAPSNSVLAGGNPG